MKRSLPLLFACSLIICVLHSKSQTYSGYYINNSGDTVQGSVHDFVYKNRTPSITHFKETTGKELQLSPLNCKGFTVYFKDPDTTLRYIAYSGKRLLNPAQFTNNLNSSAEDMYKDSSIFVQNIFDNGSMHLFMYADNQRANYFYQTSSDLIELKYKIFQSQNNEIINDRTYRDQLAIEFEEQIKKYSLQSYLDKLDYSSSDLVKFFSKLNAIKLQRVKKKYPAKLTFAIGQSTNSFAVSGYTQGRNDALTKYDNSNSITASIGFLFATQASKGRLFFFPQVKYYSTLKHSGTYNKPDNSGKSETAFTFSNLIAPHIVFGYQVYAGKIVSVAPTLGVGSLLVGKSTYQQVNYIFTTPGPIGSQTPPNKSGYYFDFGLNVGFTKYAFITLTYAPKATIAEYLGFVGKHSDVSIALGGSFPIFK